MTDVVQPFYFPPPVDIDRNTMQEAADVLGQQLATQPDLVPIRVQALNTATAVQQLQQNENAGAGGLNKTLRFQGTGALNSTEWTANSSYFSQSNNQMALNGGLADGLYFARTNYVFSTDDQAAYAQLGSEANNDQFTYLCLRCNNTGMQGVACRVSANSIAIGTYVLAGDGATGSGFSTAASVGRTQNTGDSIEFRAIGTSFVVLVNGVAVLTYSGSLGSVGTSWRNSGVMKQKASGAFGFTFYSFNLSTFGIYDYGAVGAAATNRVAARISRVTTGAVNTNIGNNGVALVPDNFFSTIDYATGMTVTEIATGSIRVDIADWYEIEVSLTAQFSAGGQGDIFAGQTHWALFLNGSQYTQGLLAGMPHKFPFAAGDIIRVALVNLQWGLRNNSNSDSNYSVLTNNRVITGISGGPGAFVQISRDS